MRRLRAGLFEKLTNTLALGLQKIVSTALATLPPLMRTGRPAIPTAAARATLVQRLHDPLSGLVMAVGPPIPDMPKHALVARQVAVDIPQRMLTERFVADEIPGRESCGRTSRQTLFVTQGEQSHIPCEIDV
ncbi:hypothetical protein GCM10017774_75400 [Lentzea cavernae]|uniref:Uncharacterized protein n=1 Tax=Lentzea cavernae TaxID=2020703 RepID=A0ABQ3MT85_9PSEU|nr:hypothetical protein GCM10017774_75400 [Lentzea cavernae]